MQSQNSTLQPWFKKKSFGWGWTPCSWQGWTLIFVFIFYIAFKVVSLDLDINSGNLVIFTFIVDIIIAIGSLVVITTLSREVLPPLSGKK